MTDFVQKACKNCPYRRDVKPYLTPQRGEELAFHATNPYNTFPCHKTTLSDDDSERIVTRRSKVCNGFLSLMHNELGGTPYDSDGFKPDNRVYDDVFEMSHAYEAPTEPAPAVNKPSSLATTNKPSNEE